MDQGEASINTIKLNHNGQMLVAGDTDGLMRIFGKDQDTMFKKRIIDCLL